jgi:hypothetical protein
VRYFERKEERTGIDFPVLSDLVGVLDENVFWWIESVLATTAIPVAGSNYFKYNSDQVLDQLCGTRQQFNAYIQW